MFHDTPLVMVEDRATLDEVVRKLSSAKVIAIDTESDSSYTYQEKVCLIQVSDLETDYIIDPLAIGDVSALGPVLGDRSIVKVLHGADYDIVCLRRDFGFRIRGLFDTLIAAQLVGMERIGLADLLGHFFGLDIDKQYQRHNWALRPLRPEHVEYARGDTHFLLALREIFLRKLTKIGRRRHMREECRLLEQRRWQGKSFDENAFLELKRAQELDTQSLRVLRRLYLYRDRQARRMDRPVYKVIPDEVLVDVARAKPRTEHEIDGLFRAASPLRRRHGKSMLAEVLEGLEDTQPLPDPKRHQKKVERPKTPLRTRLRGRQAERVLGELKTWRQRVLARDPSMTPFTVASNSTLKWIAQMRPTTIEELLLVPEVRRWQVQDFGEELLALLDKISPMGRA